MNSRGPDAVNPGAGGSGFAALESTLLNEIGLVRDLGLTLIRQRAGVAAADIDAVEQSTTQILAVIEELGRERARQRATLAALTGAEGIGLGELEARLGRPLPPSLRALREELVETARDTAGQLAVNRNVLRRAVESGDRFFETVLKSLGRALPAYGSPSERSASGDRPAFLIDKVA